MTIAEKVYSESEVERYLGQHLPHWFLDDGCVARTYRTGGWKGVLMVVNTIGHLAEAAWHHPDILASYKAVTVKLTTHSAKGITDKDLELATRIESVVQWRPAGDSALEGTPQDPRFKYVEYD